ncbi:MAG: PHP domain-containing protein, partial [Rhodobiaceae bacterium]|nr:PHP domain-containing protein [Rhodobiaceae bacterium]
MSPPFIHLRARSAYSLLEGAIKVPKLIDLAVRDRMPALALTDRHMLCGALEFSERAAAAGLQPIIGLTLGVAFREDVGRGGADATGKAIRPVALLAGNEAGYGNLMALSSRAFLDTDAQETPHVGEDVLGAHADGLIALTGGAGGPLGALLCAGQEGAARARLAGLARQFGDRLYVEVQRHGLAAERECEAAMVDLAYDLGLPIVATNDTYFAERDDYTAHDALLCIAQGRMMADTERPKLTPDFHFKPMQAMAELFADLPEALDNTVEIARRCAFRPVTHPPILPRYTPAGADASEGVDEAGELRRLARDGLEVRLEAHGLADGYSREDYAERLEFELGVIEGMKFPGYFLIVADFIRWAKEHDIPVGPGRGSGAGSLVAWSLTITDLDPMRFDLLFERFL